jgi:predicted phage terminase large subunit-like protein
LPVATEARAALALPTLEELNREMARRHHLEFMQLAWQKPAEPFLVGRHTRAICEKIDEAIERYRIGRSSFLVVAVPFRHGKSDLVSRYLPPKFLGEFPDAEVMLATYGADLANDLSRWARRIVGSSQYRGIFPIRVAQDSAAVDRWGVEGHAGGMTAAGLGGAMTGRGYALGIVDDYLKNRLEAESKAVRDARWESFTNDFLTRKAPVSITLVVATPWHVDDIIGRIKVRMREDPAFPQFEVVRFPASSDGTFAPDTLLFPERFDAAWYNGNRAALGTYGTASLMQCDPTQRGGNLLKIDRVKIIETDEVPADAQFIRFWDQASTVKDVMKVDPDWTVGVKLAVRTIRNAEGTEVPQIIIADVRRGRWEAPERERIQVQTARMDTGAVRIAAESVAGYKDAFVRLRDILAGFAAVEAFHPASDKLVRAAPLEPIFEAGNVLLVRGEWNQAYLDELSEFPSGGHDDQVDATSGGYAMASNAGPGAAWV